MTIRTHTPGVGRLVVSLLGCLVLLSSFRPAAAGAAPADDKRAEARRIAAQLDALGQSVAVLAETVDAGRLKADGLASEAAAAERELNKAQADAAGANARLSAEAVDTYVQGGIDLGGAPVKATDVGDPLRRSQYAMTLQAKKADLLDAAKAQTAIVREKRTRLEKAREQAQGAVATVERSQKDAEGAAARLQASQSKIDGELASLVEQEQEAKATADATDVVRTLAARNPDSPVAALVVVRPTRAAAADTPAPPDSPAPTVTIRLPPIPLGGPSTTRPATPPKPAPDAGNEAPAPNPGAAAAIAEARRQIGKPYRYGSPGPDSFDCSGLTSWAWRAGGRSLPHSSAAQFGSLPRVNPADARPGDLFAFGRPIHHIGIYIGGGQMIAAPQTGKNVQYQPAYRGDLTGVVRP